MPPTGPGKSTNSAESNKTTSSKSSSKSSTGSLNTSVTTSSSNLNSPYKLSKPSDLSHAFSFSVADVEASAVHYAASPRLVRSNTAPALNESLQMPSRSAASLMLNRSSREPSSPLTPSSIRKISEQRRANSGTASPTHRAVLETPPRSKSASAARPVTSDASHTTAAPPSRPRAGTESATATATTHTEVATQEGNVNFAHIMSRVRGTIGSGLVQVGSVLGARAEKVITDTSHILPLYSVDEMNMVMSKKYDLLSELSHSCMLLGLAEEKEQKYAEQQELVQTLNEKVASLTSSLDDAQHAKESLQFKCKATETELSVLKLEHGQDKEVMVSYQKELALLQERLAAHKSQVSLTEEKATTSETQVLLLRSELGDREAQYRVALQSLQEENQVLKESSTALQSQLQASQTERDHCMAELDVLQEMAESDKQAAMSECARLREGMASQQYLHKENLLKHDADLHQLRRELKEARAGLEAITDLHKLSEHEKAQLKTEVSSLNAEVLQLTSKYHMCQQDLRNAEEGRDFHKKHAHDAQARLKEQQTQLVLSTTEHGMLADQARLSALTVDALHSEISMLRRELEEQRDEVKHKEIEVKTATTKFNNTAESLCAVKVELEQLYQTHTDDVQEKLEEIAALEKNVEALRTDRVEDARLRDELAQQHAAALDALSVKCGEFEAQAEEVRREMQTLISAQANVLHERDAVLSALSAEKDSLTEALSEAQREREFFLQEHETLVAAKDADIAALTSSVASLERKLVQAEEAFTSALQQRDSELISVASKGSCIEDTLQQVRQDMARTSAEHKIQLCAKDEELVLLAEKLSQCENSLVEAKAVHAEAMTAARRQFETREKDFLTALSLAEDTQDSLRRDLHQQLAEVTKKSMQQAESVSELTVQLRESNDTIATKQRDLELRVVEVTKLTAELVGAKDIIAELEATNGQSSQSHQQASAQVSKLRQEVAVLEEQVRVKTTEAEKAAVSLQTQQTSAKQKQDIYTKEIASMQVRTTYMTHLFVNESDQAKLSPLFAL